MHFFVIGKTPDGHLGFLLEPQVSKDSGKRLLVDDIKKSFLLQKDWDARNLLSCILGVSYFGSVWELVY